MTQQPTPLMLQQPPTSQLGPGLSSDSAYTFPQQQPALWPGHTPWGGCQATAAAGPRGRAPLGLPGSALARLVPVPSGFHQQQVQQEQWRQQQEQRQQISAMLTRHADPAIAAAAAAAASGGDALTFQYNPGAFGSSFRPAAPPALEQWCCGPQFSGTSSSSSLLSGGGASQQLVSFGAAGNAGGAPGMNLQAARYPDSGRALQTFPDQQSSNQLAAARSAAAARPGAAAAAAAAANAAAMAQAAAAGTRHRSSDDGRAGVAVQQRHQQQRQQYDGRASADDPLDASDDDADEEAAAALLLGLAAGGGVAEAPDNSRSKRARQPSRKLEAALEQEPVLQALLDENERGSLSRLGSSSAAMFRAGPGPEQQQQRKRRKFVLSSKTPVAETIAAKVQYAASHFPELQMKHAGLEPEQGEWTMGDCDFAPTAAGEAGPAAPQAASEEAPEAAALAAEAPTDGAAATAVAGASAASAEAAQSASAVGEGGAANADGAAEAAGAAAAAAADCVPAAPAAPAPSTAAPAAAAAGTGGSDPGPGPAAAAAFASPGADSSTAEQLLAAIQVQQLLALRQESEQGAVASGSPAYSSDYRGSGKNRGGRPKGSGNRTQMAPRAVNRAGQPSFALRSVRYTGVYQSKRAKDGWRAQFCYSNKVLNLGTYGCEDDAARAWNAAALYFRGDGAWLNPVVPQLPATWQPGILQGPAAAVATAAAIKQAQAAEEAAAGQSLRRG